MEKKMTKVERAKLLDKQIAQALTTGRFRLSLGDGYLAKIFTNPKMMCGCAVGAALASVAKTRPALQKIYQQTERANGSTQIGDLAVELVNEGITRDDLGHMEAGFEGWGTTTPEFVAGINGQFVTFSDHNPFYRLGRRLRQQVLNEKNSDE